MLELFALLLGALRGLLSSRANLAAEHPLLHQLAALARPGRKRPRRRARHELLWVLARRLCRTGAPDSSLRGPRRWSAGIVTSGGSSGARSPAPAPAGRASARRCA